MHDELDLNTERRSFRQGKEVHSIVLERCWWQELERVCSRDNLKTWLLLWVQQARDKGLNHHALIRFRAHELVLSEQQSDQDNDKEFLLSKIKLLRDKKYTWRKIANLFNELELGGIYWQENQVRSFYHKSK